MTIFDHQQSPRLGQKTQVESTAIRMFSGEEIPEAAWAGQMIYRTDSQEIQVFNGEAWEDVVGGTAGLLTFVGPVAPVAKNVGDLWFDTTQGHLSHRWNGTSWVALPAGLDSLDNDVTARGLGAQITTPGTTAPLNPILGDTWINDSNYTFVWDGTTWRQISAPSEPLSDGTPPASSPAATVTAFALRSVRATWPAVSNADPVSYRVYVSDTAMSGTTPDPAKLFDTTPTLSVVIPATVRKYVRVLAVDTDGPATAWGAEGNALPIVFDPVDLTDLTQDVRDYIDQQEIDALAGMADDIAPVIKGYTVEYSVNASETVAPTTGWSTSQPVRTPGQFIWTRTTVTRYDDTTSTTAAALLTGNTGATGSQGIQGSAGAAGTTYYTWLKYASSATPAAGDMSDSPAGKTYMGIGVGKTSAIESTTYTDYTWSLIQGPQGNQGIPGTAGADGVTTYTWVKYAPNGNPTDLQISDLPAGMTHIGLAFNKTTATESTFANQYAWSLIQGPQGSQGIPGNPGADGVTYYTWLKYASSATPAAGDMADLPTGKTYMGIGVGKTSAIESTVYTDYNWSLIQGPQGNQGIPGNPGADGVTTYTWVKYAPNGTPTDVQISDFPAGMTHIGLAFNKTTATESTFANQYAWSLIQGPQGSQGIQGPTGPNGASLYTWLKYADTPTTGMNDFPAGKTYMGVAYNKASATESDIYTDYAWSLIQGPQGNTGIQGPAGSNGQPTYTWIKYAPNGTPTDLQISDTPAGMTYIGFAFNKTVAAESTIANDYAWSLIQGPQGTAGANASIVDLTATTQVLSATAVAGAATTPTTAVVTGTATNTTISTWTFNPDGAGFGAAPAYVSVAGNVVTVTGATMTAKSLAIRATGASGVTDTMTIAKVTAAVGISGTPAVTYQAGASATVAPVSTWLTTPPATTPGQYLWTRTITTYTDNSTGTAYAVAAHGTTGTPGTTVTGNVIDYQVGSSGTSVPVSTWVTSPVPVTTPGQFLWTRTTTSYSGGVPAAVSYSVAAHGTPGAAGADAVTVVLSNESMTFAGSTTAALGGTQDTGIIAYKGAVQQTIDVGTITVVGAPAGISAAILSGDLSTAPIIRVTTTTGLTATSGTIDVALIVAGQSFTKVISWAVNRTGAQGNTGNTGNTGTSITAVTPYWAQVTPIGATAPTQPTTQATPPGPWVANEPAFASNTDLYTTEKITYSNATYTYTTMAKSSTYSGMLPRISLIGTQGKKFSGVATYSEAGPNLVGNIVIDTPITFTAYMCKFSISGYNYMQANGTLDLEVAAYAYTTPSVVNSSAVNSGNMPVSVRVGRKISTGTMRIIIKSESTSNFWHYPRIANLDAEITSSVPPDSFLTGWTIARMDEATTLSSSDLVVAPATANLPADLSTKVQWNTSPPVNNVTIGKVGDLYYVKSGTIPNTQIDTIYECTTANNWTPRYVANAAIKDLAVGKISALGTELSKLTGGGHLIDPKPTLVANDPVVGSISWPQFKVKYQEIEYTVSANTGVGTASKWTVYRWNSGTPTIEYTNTRPTLATGDMILFSNVNGVPFRVFGTVLVDGDMVIDGSLSTNALVAKDIYSDTGYIGKLNADQIEAGQGLINELTLIGGLKLNVSPENPNGTMRLNPRDGLEIDHPDPVTGLLTGQQTYIRADGKGSQFIGNATLDELTVLKGLNLSGTEMGVSGTLKTQNGFTTPTSPVSVSGTYPVNTNHTNAWWAGTGGTRDKTTAYFRGICDDPSGNSFIVARYGIFGSVYSDVLWGARTSTDSYILGDFSGTWAPAGGITRIANTYYILCCGRSTASGNYGAYYYDSWRVWKMDATTGAINGSFDVTHTGAANRLPVIGNDGTNLLVLLSNTQNSLYLRVIAPGTTGTAPMTQTLLGTAGAWTGTTPTGIVRTFANGPTGLDRYYVSSEYGGGYPYLTTGPKAPDAEYFPLAAGTSRGMFIDPHDNGAIKTFHVDGRIYSYTWLRDTWQVGHSWYGSSRGSPLSGEAETLPKMITVTPPRFSTWGVALSEKPPGTEADKYSPNAARIYAGPPAPAVPTLQDTMTLTENVYKKTYTVPWPVTVTTPVLTNGFSARPGGLGVIESVKKNTAQTLPLWRFEGAGSVLLGDITMDAAGNVFSRGVLLKPSQAGTVSTSAITAGANWTEPIATVTFPYAFASAPSVMLTIQTAWGGSDVVSLLARTVTASGFTIAGKCTTAKSAMTVYWTATQQ